MNERTNHAENGVQRMESESDMGSIETSDRESIHGTMVQNKKKHTQKSYSIIHFPMSEEVSEVSEVSERASERLSAEESASKASRAEQVNE